MQTTYNREVLTINSVIRVNPKLIPSMETKLLCATFLEAVIQFYKDPDHVKAFEQWRREKGGSAYGSQDS